MEDKRELLLSYIKANVAPILVDFISGSDMQNAVVLPANVDRSELNGHYEETEFVPPLWYKELTENEGIKLLIIDKIDSIEKQEQPKFCELLEQRKISTFELPENCIIIVTANKINKHTISEEIYSLTAKI